MTRRAIPLAAVAALLASPLLAAPVPPPPRADDTLSPTAVRLLQHRKVQKELKLTAEQRIVILDGLADVEEEHEKKVDAVSRMPNLPDDAFDKLDKERRKGIDRLLADAAAKGLGANQRKRLHQLDWRVRGAAAFTDPKVEKVLQLTDAQKKKATELAERQRSVADSYFENLGNDDAATRKADLLASRTDFLKQMEDALTADQKANWAALLGDAATGFVIDDLWLKIEEDADAGLPSDGGK